MKHAVNPALRELAGVSRRSAGSTPGKPGKNALAPQDN